jgi:hypothetical protein
MSDRDQQLWQALCRMAILDHVAEPLTAIAFEARLSEAQVRRGLRDLVDAGSLEPAGKRGKTSVFRLLTSPARGKRADDTVDDDDAPPKGRRRDGARVAVVAPTPRPLDENEQAWADHPDELRQLGLADLDSILDHFPDGVGPPDHGPGPCGECDEPARRRWSFGRFVLCRRCRARRTKADRRLADQEPTLDEQLLQAAQQESHGDHSD